MAGTTNDGMRDLIKMVNRMQDAYAELGAQIPIDLPQIAVIGGQSAGKSSVLENFVGKDFLPRGSGIVTRRPLILQLNYCEDEEYGEFLHCKGQKFTDFNEIRAEIEAETDRMTGSNKGISNVPINLRVFSPEVLDLTLIDLPGLTKVAVGDQPEDIEFQIYSMLMEFITRENCIILAVTPANQDLANSDALKLAKEVDPEGVRTIGVLTKLDLMDAGTDARDILENKSLPLRRGYVGVVNRSQADINGNKDIRAALDAERKFFVSREEYRHLADKMGTKYLQKVLNQQLVNHIREKLPILKQQLQKQVSSMEAEVRAAQTDIKDPVKNNTKNLVKMVNALGTDISTSIEGSRDAMNLTKLSGGARIAKVFHERFPYAIARMELDERQLRQEIAFAIRNVNGIRVGLFTPDEAFEGITKRLIEKLRPACMMCCDMVCEELMALVSESCSKLDKYPRFQNEVIRIIEEFLTECESKTKDQIDLAVSFELAYINANHPDFIGFQNAQNGGRKSRKKGRVKSADGVIRKGWLSYQGVSTLSSVFGAKISKHWFVLKEDELLVFKDDSERDQKLKIIIPPDEYKIDDIKRPGTNGNVFKLFHPDGIRLHKDFHELELTAVSKENKEAWQASFLLANVTPCNEESGTADEEVSEDPELSIQTEIIRNLVDSYMGIVVKGFQDVLPKICMHFMVNSIIEFTRDELLASLYKDVADVEELLEESDQSRKEREELIKVYEASKSALKAISDVTMKTKSEPLPPPVENSIKPGPKPAPSAAVASKAVGAMGSMSGRMPVPPARAPTISKPTMPSKPPSRPAPGMRPPARAPPPPMRPNRPAK